MTTNKDTERAELSDAQIAEFLPSVKHAPNGVRYEVYCFEDVCAAVRKAAALLAADKAGDVAVTKNQSGQIVAVTRQDSEGRILQVIAESAADRPEPRKEGDTAELVIKLNRLAEVIEHSTDSLITYFDAQLIRGVAALLAADKAGGEVVAWTVLEENADERRMFNESVKFIGGGSPILAIAETLRTMAAVQPNGSFRDQLRIMANEVAKFYIRPQPQPVPDDVVKDAERYRWLRDGESNIDGLISGPVPELLAGSELDAAIDAAMLKEGK